MKHKARIRKLESKFGKPEDKIIVAWQLENGKYSLEDNKEVSLKDLEQMKGIVIICEWV